MAHNVRNEKLDECLHTLMFFKQAQVARRKKGLFQQALF